MVGLDVEAGPIEPNAEHPISIGKGKCFGIESGPGDQSKPVEPECLPVKVSGPEYIDCVL